LRVQFREDGSGRGFSALDLRRDEGGVRSRCRFRLPPGPVVPRGRRGPGGVHPSRPPGDGIDLSGGRTLLCPGLPGGDDGQGFLRNRGTGFPVPHLRPAGRSPGTVPPDGERQLAEAYRGDLPLAGVRIENRVGRRLGDVRTLFLQAARQFDGSSISPGSDAGGDPADVAGFREPSGGAVHGDLRRMPSGAASGPPEDAGGRAVVEFTRALAGTRPRPPGGPGRAASCGFPRRCSNRIPRSYAAPSPTRSGKDSPDGSCRTRGTSASSPRLPSVAR